LHAVRGEDGPLLGDRRVQADLIIISERYTVSCLFRGWRSSAGPVNQTPDYRILAEWILTLNDSED
jgi:hypothetical protein